MDLRFHVHHQNLQKISREKVVANSNEYLYISVKFSDDWDGTMKDCIGCIKPGSPIEFSADAMRENVWYVPQQMIQPPGFEVSFVGISGNKRITTNTVHIDVSDSGYVSGEMPEDKEPTKYEQLMAELQKIKEEAETAIQDAVNKALESIQGIITEGIINDKVESAATTYSSHHIEEKFISTDDFATEDEVGSVLDKYFGKI